MYLLPSFALRSSLHTHRFFLSYIMLFIEDFTHLIVLILSQLDQAESANLV
jgi:hypothetical protein